MATGRKTGGRAKGTPNKITRAAREAFELAFERLGAVDGLVKWARKHPTDFYRIYGRLIPIEAQLNADGKIVVEIQPFGGAHGEAQHG